MANKSCLLHDKAQLLCPAKKITNSAAKGLQRINLCPRSSIRGSFPSPHEGFRGRGQGGNASPSSEPSAGGAGAGMSEFGEGRTNPSRPMPSLEGAERGLVQLLPSWSDSPFPALPIPALPTPSHPREGTERPDPPHPRPHSRARGDGWGSAAPGASVGEKE